MYAFIQTEMQRVKWSSKDTDRRASTQESNTCMVSHTTNKVTVSQLHRHIDGQTVIYFNKLFG